MNKAFYAVGSIVAGLVLAAGLAVQSGCEPATGLVNLTITPSYVILPVGSNTVELTVGGGPSNSLAIPIEWNVSNPELGFIARSAGYSALYYRHAISGDNIITARDQYDNEGYATVRQVQGEQSLTLSATRADTNTWTIAIVNPPGGPYEWWVRDPAIGNFTTIGTGPTAVYDVKDFSESNDIYCRDHENRIGAVTIP